jgi:hypothetical protein
MRAIIRALRLAALGLSLAPAASALHAQEGAIDVVVTYIAGSNVYLNAGAERGLGTGDTLLVFSESHGRALGAFRVISSAEGRAVVTFAGRPFPVTRGARLRVAASSSARAAATAEPAAQPRAVAQLGSARRTRTLRMSGRLALDFGVLESSTEAGDGSAAVERRFATPALRLRTTVHDLPGGLSFVTNLRAATRLSSNDAIQPDGSLRIYQASLGKEFRAVPLSFQVGRFYNPYESFSGYWDGLLVRLGRSGLGAGISVGFQPERGNEGFSSDLPKYGAFLDYQYSGGGVRYRADVAFNELRPRIGVSAQRFAGLSQRFYWRRLGLTQRIRFDQRAGGGAWELTQLELRAAVPIARPLTALFGYSYWATPILELSAGLDTDSLALAGLERERANVGLAYNLSRGSIGADVTANKMDDGDISYTYAAHFGFARTGLGGLGFFGSASYWEHDATSTLHLAPGVSRTFGRLESRFSYSRYAYANRAGSLVTHALDLSLTFPFTRRWYGLLQGRVQRGKTLNSYSLYSGLWLSF